MRPIRHPIGVFVVAVLTVVGIGVGVVAATTHQKVYGPPSGRFTAAFPGRVYESDSRQDCCYRCLTSHNLAALTRRVGGESRDAFSRRVWQG